MQYKDYYQIMGLARDATEAQIKQAYRKLARKFHPDVSKEADAEARFKELGEAYEVLKDPEKRAAYDQLGTHHRSGEEFQPPPDWATGFEFRGANSQASHADFSDFFSSLFTQGFTSNKPGTDSHRNDHHAKVLLDLEAALQGGTRSFTLQFPELNDQGRLITTERTLNVRIPKGIVSGQQIRLAGQGARTHQQATPGDLYLTVEFKPHPFYRVEGRDLTLPLPITPWEAALGATVTLPTPNGPVELKIPAGARHGSKLRLKGRGIPASTPGDLFAQLEIVLPAANTDKAKALYNEMASTLAFNPRQHLGV